MRALLECAWPASLDAAGQPFRWATWPAAMSVILDRDGGDLARTRPLGLAGSRRPCARKSSAVAGGTVHEDPASAVRRVPIQPG